MVVMKVMVVVHVCARLCAVVRRCCGWGSESSRCAVIVVVVVVVVIVIVFKLFRGQRRVVILRHC